MASPSANVTRHSSPSTPTLATADPGWNPLFTFDNPSVLPDTKLHLLSPTQRSPHLGPTSTLPLDSLAEDHATLSPTFGNTLSLSPPPVTPTKVGRPPNAFMLFRSDFLKKRTIPDHVEKRQQNLSRIAGEVWNMMSAEEKMMWHELAARRVKDHQKAHPNYKFTPAPRGSRRNKNTLREDGGCSMAETEIRKIREKFTGYHGASPAPNRRRKPVKSKSVEVKDRAPASYSSPQANTSNVQYSCDMPQTRLMQPALPQLMPAQAVAAASAPTSPARNGFCAQPMFYLPEDNNFPRVTIPRRPSTSLGFVEHGMQHPSLVNTNLSQHDRMPKWATMHDPRQLAASRSATYPTNWLPQQSRLLPQPLTAQIDTSLTLPNSDVDFQAKFECFTNDGQMLSGTPADFSLSFMPEYITQPSEINVNVASQHDREAWLASEPVVSENWNFRATDINYHHQQICYNNGGETSNAHMV